MINLELRCGSDQGCVWELPPFYFVYYSGLRWWHIGECKCSSLLPPVPIALFVTWTLYCLIQSDSCRALPSEQLFRLMSVLSDVYGPGLTQEVVLT